MRYEELKQRSYRLGDLSLGSIQMRWVTCGNPKCKCGRGQKHGPYPYLSLMDKESGKMVHIYLSKDELSEFKRRIQNYKNFETELWELMKIEVKIRRGRTR